jgi:hypothetical protein
MSSNGERHISLEQLQASLVPELDQAIQEGTILLITKDLQPEPIVAILPMQLYRKLLDHLTAREGPPIEARVGGVAGGIVAGAGAAIGSVTGKRELAEDARKLGRRVGRALAAGIDVLHHPERANNQDTPHPQQ